jgi:hypothetical protein
MVCGLRSYAEYGGTPAGLAALSVDPSVAACSVERRFEGADGNFAGTC